MAKSPAIIVTPAARPRWRITWAERENERRRRGHDAEAEAWLRLTVAPDSVGARGHPLPKGLRVLDAGMAVVTNHRVAFSGRTGRREWAYAEMVGPAHHPDVPVTLLHTTDGGRLAGLRVPAAATVNFRFYLTLAFADATGQRAAVAAQLDDLAAAHQDTRPVPPPPADPDQAPLTAVRPGRRAASVAAVAAVAFATLTASAFGSEQAGMPYRADMGGSGVVASEAPSGTSATAPSTGGGPEPPRGGTAAPGTSVVGVPREDVSSGPPGLAGPGTRVPPTVAAPGSGSRPAPITGPAPTTTAPAPEPTVVGLCGAPDNPYGYNYCGGSYIHQPASDVCSYFACVADFRSGAGYLVRCEDGMIGMVGGKSGSCADHRGVKNPVYR
ncbi:hypothetical protein [Micromonospora sp. NPDC002717]|uniref:hypothetical protein n=1 Tax=Micromonospora sp. NPDC002717 TaxID=3154424 RepID=UPI00331D1ADB